MSVDVRATILARIDPATMRGIEIGPLHNPRLTKDEANIRYLDHASREGLGEKYAGNPEVEPRAAHIVDIDYVWTPGKRLVDIVGDWAPIDYVIASHVIEHLGNMVDWLQQVAELLVPGGALSLVIPDKRYTFDARRGLTSLASFVDSYLRGVEQPTLAQIFDHEAMFLGRRQDAVALATDLWAGTDPSGIVREDVPNALQFAYDRCAQQAASREYLDIHASTFTPSSFVDIMGGLAEIGLTTFGVAEIVPTQVDFYEFYVTLENLNIDDPERRRLEQRRRVERAHEMLAMPPETPAVEVGPGGGHDLEVSDAEERLVRLKRAIMLALRQGGDRARRGARKVRGPEVHSL